MDFADAISDTLSFHSAVTTLSLDKSQCSSPVSPTLPKESQQSQQSNLRRSSLTLDLQLHDETQVKVPRVLSPQSASTKYPISILKQRNPPKSSDTTVATSERETSDSIFMGKKSPISPSTSAPMNLQLRPQTSFDLTLSSRNNMSSSQSYHSKTSRSSKASTFVHSVTSSLKSVKRVLALKKSGQSVKLDPLKNSSLNWKMFPPLLPKLSGKFTHDKTKATVLSKWVCVEEFSPTPTSVPIWVSKFSTCGRLLATAGEDGLIFIWTLEQFRHHFNNTKRLSSDESIAKPLKKMDPLLGLEDQENRAKIIDTNPFGKGPLVTFTGHTGMIMDLSWSKKEFLASASKDGSVIIWHVKKEEPILQLDHKDNNTYQQVVACQFLNDSKQLYTVTVNGVVRHANIIQKQMKICLKVDLQENQQVSTLCICNHDSLCVIGTGDGRLLFYEIKTTKLELLNCINISSKTRTGPKLYNIQSYGNSEYESLVVTSSDDKIRIYGTKDYSCLATFKGFKSCTEMDGAKIDNSNKLVVVSSSQASLCLFPYSSNEYHLGTSKIASLPGNQYFLPGYTSKSFVSIDVNSIFRKSSKKYKGPPSLSSLAAETSSAFSNFQITSFAIAPRVDFFTDFFNAINLSFDQRPSNVIVTTDTAGKIRILLNAHEKV